MFDMLSNVMKNLFSKPATRNYPYEKREAFKDTRGQIEGIDIDSCIFCGLCSRKCPSDAINVDKHDKSWEIDRYKCVICGVCTEVCPKKCIFMGPTYKTSSYNKDTQKYTQKPKESKE